MKVCSLCAETKPLEEFSKKTGTRRQSRCKSCFRSVLKLYRKQNQDSISKRRKAAYKTDPLRYNKQNQDSYIRNHTKRVKYASEYVKTKLETDLVFKVRHKIRDRFHKALKGNYKKGSAVKNLGCSIEFLVKYLETRFAVGMTWDNYGVHGWHIDHIMPLSKFDLNDPVQIAKACHYTNLQPLWATDNIRKGNR